MSESANSDSQHATHAANDTEHWWRHAVIYQIYPRSFKDSSNDGIGDLNGITEKLDYIADLGVDAIWVSPFSPSPMKDFGYDVTDYRDVDPMFGTLDDFKTLLHEANKRGLKIIIDLVLSHTSDQHPWFHDPAKKDWYVWADAKHDPDGNRQPPNNWSSLFGGSAWEWDERYNQYYLHNFLKEQPDLNFHNPAVQEEILDICKFWLDMGVNGFRLDTVNFYFHSQSLKDNPHREVGTEYATQFEHDVPYSRVEHIYDKSQPENIIFVEKLRALTDTYKGIVLMGEIGDDKPYERTREYTLNVKRLHTCYNTHLMSGTEKSLNANMITQPLIRFFARDLSKNHLDQNLTENVPIKLTQSGTGWPTWALSNHDVVRVASRWYKLYDHDAALSKCLIALLGCLPGTICLYQGEELGLPEAEIPFEDLQDPWAKQTWPHWQGRDGCRTPMVWTDKKPYCDFSKGKPWLPIPETHKSLNVQAQKEDKASTLNFTKKFLKWRANNKFIFENKCELIATNASNIVHLSYKSDNNKTECIFNLSDEKIEYNGTKLEKFGIAITGFDQKD